MQIFFQEKLYLKSPIETFRKSIIYTFTKFFIIQIYFTKNIDIFSMSIGYDLKNIYELTNCNIRPSTPLSKQSIIKSVALGYKINMFK